MTGIQPVEDLLPLLEQGQWPSGSAWLGQLQQLAGQTEEALKAYCAAESSGTA